MEHFKIEETDIWTYVSKTADDVTIYKVENWMNSSSFDKDRYTKITKIYSETSEQNIDIAKAKSNFFETIKPQKKHVWKNILKYAAILVVFLSGAYFYNSLMSNGNEVIIQTTFGEQKNISLPDGSKVWLNASTKLTYDSENPRKLYLEGEGFFEVAKDKSHPFTVTTSDDITVKALGTSFNVKSYTNNSITETKLLTGKVEIMLDKLSKKNILMNPNDKVVFYKDSKDIIKSTMTFADSKIAWKEGKIQFKNKTFKQIATDLKTQFNIQIKFENKAIANSKFTGTFKNTIPITEIFEILKISKNFNYQLNTTTNEWVIK